MTSKGSFRLFGHVLIACLGLGTARAQRGDAPDARFLSPEEERALFTLPPGFEIQLVASDPDIQKPLNLNFDAAGRVWVTGTELYPWPAKTDAVGQPIAAFAKNWEDNTLAFRAMVQPPQPAERGRDTVRVLSDFGPDGRARKISTFADGLNIPTGVQPLPRRPGSKGDTVVVFSIPAIWRLEDTDGDGRADVRERLYGDFGFKDTHGMSSNYVYWVDGWVYGTHGFANHSEIRDRAGNLLVLDSGNTYRFRPDGSRIEPWAHGQTNPFGLTFDPRGDLYSADSHSKPVYLLLHGGFYEGIYKSHDGLGFAPAITTDNHGSSAIAGIAFYADTQFPREYRGNLFNGNPVTRRVNRDRLDWQGSTPKAERQADFLTSDDPAFRPVQVKLGPDGALWIADFYNPIIGHYEVPLTHPKRDRAHGRIWRIVWRGLNREVPAPVLPNLADDDAEHLAEWLDDPNLIVRTLAAHELVDRIGAAVVPVLRARAEKIFAEPGASPAFQLAHVLERLSASDDRLLFEKLISAGDDTAVAALRILAERPDLGAQGEQFFSRLIARTIPGPIWRQTADIFTRHPQSWQAPLLLSMRAQALDDRQLIYALRLALKTHAARATAADLNRWISPDPEFDGYLADVCLAVATPAAGEFLLGHLERTLFNVPRAGEYARHAIRQIPPGQMAVVESLVMQLGSAPPDQQSALAEGLAHVSRQPGRALPAALDAWMRRTLLAAFENPDAAVATRAIEASKGIPIPEKYALLRKIAFAPDTPASVRDAAVENLPPDPQGTPILVDVLANGRSVASRKSAAKQLGVGDPAAMRSAFLAVLPTASSDFALTLAIALAKTDAGADALTSLVAAGKVSSSLLRHAYVASALEARPAALRARVAALTKDIPSEDARIDAILAQRGGAFASARPDPDRGAAVFAQNCAACHRFRDAGGNIGPNLDGLAARGVQRIMEDILDPSRNVDPTYRLATVTTTTGESRSGMNYREQGGDILIADPATGQDTVMQKASVASVTRLPISAMPGAFDSAIPEKEFYDLIGYLLRPAP